jgi:hypothetical protein
MVEGELYVVKSEHRAKFIMRGIESVDSSADRLVLMRCHREGVAWHLRMGLCVLITTVKTAFADGEQTERAPRWIDGRPP